MRLFIAIDCNDIKEKLVSLQEIFKPLNVTLTSNFHITLKFLGEVDEEQLLQVISALKQIEYPSFKIEINKLGSYKSAVQKVVWTGFTDFEKVAGLQKEIDEALSAIFEKQKKYSPHITLARIKKYKWFTSKEKAVLKKALDSDIDPISLEIKSFNLVQSVLTRKGPVYKVLKSFGLNN